jgi:hypothetical protein
MPAGRSSADVTALLRDAGAARPGAGDRLFEAVDPERADRVHARALAESSP